MLLVNTRLVRYGTEDCLQKVPWLAPVPESQEEQVCIPSDNPEMEEGEVQPVPLPRGDGDRRAGFEGSFFFHNQTVLFGSSYTHTAATGWQRTK